jgi:hypothetical protein
MNVPLARTIAGAAVATAVLSLAAPPALARSDGDRERRGSCSRSSDWKVKVGPEDGRLEVEGEIDSSRRGQVWRWRLYHNGSLSAHGLRTTGGRSGSFEVRRLSVDLRGTDRFTLRARNTRNNELCVGTVNY